MRGKQARGSGSIFDVMASELAGCMTLGGPGEGDAGPADAAALERQWREMSERIIS